jgi:hypothetical protein
MFLYEAARLARQPGVVLNARAAVLTAFDMDTTTLDWCQDDRSDVGPDSDVIAAAKAYLRREVGAG